MIRDFEIVNGVCLVKSYHRLDLHNDFIFVDLNYSVKNRSLQLNWQRSNNEWVALNTPKSLCIGFHQVSEFRFLPRDSELPFTEDDCLN